MSLSVRSPRVIAVAVVCVLATGAAASGATQPPPIDVPVPTETASAKAHREQLERRQSATARREREETRTRYRSADSTEALALARRAFPEITQSAQYSGSLKDGGVTVRRRPDKRTAVARTADGDRVLATSTHPLTTTRGETEPKPVDLALESTDRGFEPKRPLAGLRIGRQADDGVAFTDTGITVTPAGAPTRAGTVTDDRVFFHEVDTDTDYLVLPNPTGAEASWIVRSAGAPESFVLDIDLPDGARLVRAQTDDPIPGDPPRVINVERDGKVLAAFQPPVAYDRDGIPVEVDALIVGDKLVYRMPHRERDLRYPLHLDPVISVTSHYGKWAGWTHYQNPGTAQPGVNYYGVAIDNPAYYHNGLYLSMPTNTWYSPNGTAAHFEFRAPPFTYLSRSILGPMAHYPFSYAGNYFSRWYNGIIAPNGGWEWSSNYVNNYGQTGPNPFGASPFAASNVIHDFCFLPRCNDAIGSEGNAAIFGFAALNEVNTSAIFTGPYSAAATLGYAINFIGDRRAPTLNVLSQTSTAWFDDQGHARTANVSAADLGLGVSRVKLSGPSTPTLEKRATALNGDTSANCTGNPYAGKCPANWATGFDYTLDEGTNTLTFTAIDAVDNASASQTVTLRVDRTPPTVALPLVGDPVDPHPDDDHVYVATDEQMFGLELEPADGLSGVQRVRLLDAQGSAVATHVFSCNPDCPRDPSALTLSAPTAGLVADNLYSVEVTDAAGHSTTVPVRLIADRDAPPPPGDIALQGYDLGTDAIVSWEAEEDHDISQEIRGSGVSRFEYRLRPLLGQFSDWAATEVAQVVIPGQLPGAVVEVEVRQVDNAGNVGASASAQIMIVPTTDPAPPTPSGGTNLIEVVSEYTSPDGPLARAGETVSLRSLSTGEVFPTETDGNGRVTFDSVPDGDYVVTVGSDQATARNVHVSGSQQATVASTSDYGDLTDEERDFCFGGSPKRAWLCRFFKTDAEKAKKFADRLFTQPEARSDGTRTNAFKHAFWVAQMVRSIERASKSTISGLAISQDDYPLAIEFARAHESRTRNSSEPNDRRHTAMDDHNNELGYAWAVANLPDARGRFHNDEFFCNTLRGRNRLAYKVQFRRGVHTEFAKPLSARRPAYRHTRHPDTGQRIKLKSRTDFDDNAPCKVP